ncbi:MAG: SapC family protein [Alphaproteobacteria bacterium]|uniref:SapC family protein n=1 Tax=Brevundimonas sp. TaxID=1871086 RepID=UPI0017A2C7DF|nr:SapC family protein [Brevundimonas sp.]MBA3048207.1 SapC family protein [Brevundimonas sp.]MBU3970682.1 SapC family protein [Alphaproteobacteria bacterium]MBU3973705.1 SapC family protein [Alphaproteobacteria bacterium]MBU4038396.1 SapC family protein [Alphaproteobacteria bacterium]
MTDTTATAQAALSGNVLFYGKPEPLSVEAHGGLGVDPVEKPYGFVAQTNLVPLTVTEFAPAALSYPVIFVGDARMPVAVMGLRGGENLFVNDAGEFRPEAYIPAYVRRYPFVFANDDVQKRLILCVDREAPFIREGGATPLFIDGKPSPYVDQAMEFCNNFELERQRTDAFVKLLTDLDLLDTREAVFTPRNPDGTAAAPQKIAEYFAVSEDKLKALPAEKLVELRDNGALGQIYAHLVSLLGWDRLIAMTFQRNAAAAQPAAANA